VDSGGPKEAQVHAYSQVASTFPHERAHWRHLANTTEPSVCGCDVALCQITLTTCYIVIMNLYTCILMQQANIELGSSVAAALINCLLRAGVGTAITEKNIAIRRMNSLGCVTLLRRAGIDSLCRSRAVPRSITRQPVAVAPIVEYLFIVLNDATAWRAVSAN